MIDIRPFIYLCLWTILPLLLILTLCVTIDEGFLKDVEFTETKTIHSLSNKESLNGSFLLGTGNFESRNSYKFYTEENGYLIPNTINGEIVKILRTSNEKPNIKYIYTAKVLKKMDEKASPSEIKSKAIFYNGKPKEIILVVPENTIELNFSLEN